MQSRSRWDFFDMLMRSANKGGGGEKVLFSKKEKKHISDCLDIVLEKQKNLRSQLQRGLVGPDLLAGSGQAKTHLTLRTRSDRNLLLFAIRLRQSM